ncbi:MAG: hypothetical protein PW844_21590 [Pantoea sp.]|uniref:hypothetical protein n=1 Tax=Pantoea sp. TaxID=69393 RepID=UPI002385F814|nr:hypothetical protein [Pantoea sp.]MDE1189024.1 hypothetical protein [Pantoea sp.]
MKEFNSLPGVTGFDDYDALLSAIRHRLHDFLAQPVTQPHGAPPLSWQRMSEDFLAFLAAKYQGFCDGSAILPMQGLLSDAQILARLQAVFPFITDARIFAQFPSRYPHLYHLLMREIFQVSDKPLMEVVPGAGKQLIVRTLAALYPLPALLIHFSNAIRFAPVQGIQPLLQAGDQYATGRLLGSGRDNVWHPKTITFPHVITHLQGWSCRLASSFLSPVVQPQPEEPPEPIVFTLKLIANSVFNEPNKGSPLRLAPYTCAEFLRPDQQYPRCAADFPAATVNGTAPLQGRGVVTFEHFTAINDQGLVQEGTRTLTSEAAVVIHGCHIPLRQSPVKLYQQQRQMRPWPSLAPQKTAITSAVTPVIGTSSSARGWIISSVDAEETTALYQPDWWKVDKRGFAAGFVRKLEFETEPASASTPKTISWPGWVAANPNTPTCMAAPAPLTATSLRDMLNQLSQRIETLPTQRLADLLGETTILTACDRLVSWDSQHHRLHIDPVEAADFIARLPDIATFKQHPEAINAFVHSARGRAALARRLLLALDHSFDATGRPLLISLQQFSQRIKPATTTWRDLAAVLLDMERVFSTHTRKAIEVTISERQAQDKLVAKLDYLMLTMMRQEYPMLKLCDHPDLASERCLSRAGYQRAVAAHEIQDERILNEASGEELERFGSQLMYRRSEPALLADFAATDKLFFNPRQGMHHYLTEMQLQQQQLIHYHLYASRLKELLSDQTSNAVAITQTYHELRATISAWYQLVLENLSADDQAFYREQWQTPQGLQMFMVRLEHTTGGKNETSCVGCYLYASRDLNTRALFITPIAPMNRPGHPGSFDASDEFSNREQAQSMLNGAGKVDMLTRLSPAALPHIASYRFLVDAQMRITPVDTCDDWPQCATAIARQISEYQFPTLTVATTPTVQPPNLLEILYGLNPITRCYSAIRSAMLGESLKNIALKFVGCAVSVMPEEEAASEIEQVGVYALNSVYHWLANSVMDHPALPTISPLAITRTEAGLVDDSLVGAKLCSTSAFQPGFGKELLLRSLPLNNLPRGYNLTGVIWDEFTDQLHCNVTTPAGAKNYLLDRKNQYLLPQPETAPPAGLIIPLAEFWQALSEQRLPTLIASLSPISQVPLRFSANEANNPERDIVYNHLDPDSIPADWRYQCSWIKTDPHPQLIVEFRNASGTPVYVQPNHAGQWRNWQPAPPLQRQNRDTVSPEPLFFDALTPSSSGYQAVMPYASSARIAAVDEVARLLPEIPLPLLLKKIHVKSLFQNIASRLHPTFEQFGGGVAKRLVEELSTWRKPLTDRVVEILEEALRNYKHVHYKRGIKAIDGFIVDLEHVLSERRKIAERYNDFLIKYHKYYQALKNLERIIIDEQSTLNTFLWKLKKSLFFSSSPFILKTHDEEQLLIKYPQEAEGIKNAIHEVRHNARLALTMVDPAENPGAMLKYMKMFFAKKNIDSNDVAFFKKNFVDIMETASALSLDKVHIVEDRFLSDGRIPANCARLALEKMLLGTNVVGYTSSKDDYQRVYLMWHALKGMPTKELANVFFHEGEHSAMSLKGEEYVGTEVYLDAGHPLKKLTIRGMSILAKNLMSDVNIFKDYLLDDDQFLDAFLTHFYEFTHDPAMKEKIVHFRSRYLPYKLTASNNKSKENKADKYRLFTPIVESAFFNIKYMIEFTFRNADLLVSFLGMMLDYAKKQARPLFHSAHKRETESDKSAAPPTFYNQLAGVNATTDIAHSLFRQFFVMYIRNHWLEE